MARTAIAISDAGRRGDGGNLTATQGDFSNAHSLDPGQQPRLVLIANNYHTSTVLIYLDLSSATELSMGQEQDMYHALPAAVAGVPGVTIINLDMSAIVHSSSGQIQINSPDPNVSSVRFYCYTWQPTALGG